MYFIATEADDCGQLCCVIPLPNAQLAQHSIQAFFGAKKRKEKRSSLEACCCCWAPFTRVEAAISSGWKASTTNLVSSSNFIMKEDLENCLKNVACIFYFVRNTGCIIRLKACLEKLALLTFLIFMLGLVSTYPWVSVSDSFRFWR